MCNRLQAETSLALNKSTKTQREGNCIRTRITCPRHGGGYVLAQQSRMINHTCANILNAHKVLPIDQNERVHSGEKPYVCSRTHSHRRQAFYMYPSRMHASLCRQSRTLEASTNSHTRKPYKCNHPECTRRFADRSSLVKHLHIHTSKKAYICSHPGSTGRITKKAHYYVLREGTRVRIQTHTAILYTTGVLPVKTVS